MPRAMSVYERAKIWGLWTPELLKSQAKLLALYDCNQAGTVTTASGRVTSLADASGFGRTLTSAGTGPTWLPNGFGGYPCADYAGAEGLANYAVSLGATQTFFVFAAGTMTGSSSNARLVSTAAATGFDSDAGIYIPLLRPATDNTLGAYGSGFLDVEPVTPGDRFLACSRLTGSACIVSVNGSADSSAAFTTPSSTMTKIAIGCHSDGFSGSFWYGQVNKVLLGVSFTARDQALVEGWAAWDTGLVDVLSASHEFKNRPPMNGD